MAYIDVEDLAAILKVDATTREADLTRVIDAAAGKIDAYIGVTLGISDDAWKLALAAHVNLELAQDMWALEQVPVGIMGLETETPLFTPRNSFERHENMLSPLKTEWAIS